MNKFLPYFLGLLLLAGLIFIIATTKKPGRVLDERVTLREKDKIPYGFYVARNLLPSVFPSAKIHSDSKEPGQWTGIDMNSSGQLVVLTGSMISAYSSEVKELLKFVERGNYVFIIGQYFNYEIQKAVGASATLSVFSNTSEDSFTVSLRAPRFSPEVYGYPGKKFSGHFIDLREKSSVILGNDEKINPNFMQVRVGEGLLFINLSPTSFSNYFLLYGNNIEYYESAFSLVPKDVKVIVWNEYFLTKKPKEKEPGWLSVLLKYPAFRAGLLIALLTIILYMLMEMRRRQRYIPVYQKPKNESLDFVQTVGRLYYDKKDHLDLARKMSAYFLDHVREKYRLQTEKLNEDFVASLQGKTGFDVGEIKKIVEFISFIRTAPAISEGQLARFHNQLETFYKNT
jgi:hypothetical protein